MTADEVSDEMLMAAVDGELDAEQAAEIERLAAANPAIARRMASFRESRLAAAAAFADVLAEPVPERLVAAGRGTAGGWRLRQSARQVVRVGANSPRREWRRYAVAAAFVLVAGTSAFVGSRLASTPDENLIALAGDPRLLSALAAAPAGVDVEAAGLVARAVASYRTESGYCRVYVAQGTMPGSVRGLACSAGGTFSPVLAAIDSGAGGYQPADDAVAASIDSYLDAAGAGPALTPEEEAASLAGGWR
jgi:hypothetical protein